MQSHYYLYSYHLYTIFKVSMLAYLRIKYRSNAAIDISYVFIDFIDMK